MTEILKHSDSGDTKLSLDEQKAELAELYLSFLDSKKNDIIGTASNLGVSLNPLKDAARDYLLAQDKKKDIFGKLADNLKKALIKKVSSQTQIDLEYDRVTLDKMKTLLQQTETIDQLNILRKQIQEGQDPTAVSLDLTSTSPKNSTTDVLSPSVSSSSSGTVENLTVVSSVALLPELQKLRDNIEIDGSFANIKKVKNVEGKTILECTGKSPYINVKALDDLIGLADAFFKKTGKPLSLNSAYRDIDHQEELKKNNKKRNIPTADPGKSGHNLGLSIDIHGGDRYEKTLGGIQGFRDLAKQYNFNPIRSEDWHFDHDSLHKIEDRLDLAQLLDREFQNERLAA